MYYIYNVNTFEIEYDGFDSMEAASIEFAKRNLDSNYAIR